MQAIAIGYREVYLCYCEGSMPTRAKRRSSFLTLYQCKIFVTWKQFHLAVRSNFLYESLIQNSNKNLQYPLLFIFLL